MPKPEKVTEEVRVTNVVEVRGRLNSLTNQKSPKIVESVED